MSDYDVLLEGCHMIFRPIDGIDRARNEVGLDENHATDLERLVVFRPLITPYVRYLPVASIEALEILQCQELQILVLVYTPMNVMVQPVLSEEIHMVNIFVLITHIPRQSILPLKLLNNVLQKILD